MSFKKRFALLKVYNLFLKFEGTYTVEVETITVGCKKGTLVSEWKKVLDAF